MTVEQALPTGRAGQALAVAMALLAAVVVVVGVISPAIGWYQDRAAQLRQAQARAVRMERLVASLPALRQQTRQRAARAVPRDALLEGGTDAVAAAALQSKLDELANAAGLHIGSAEVLPAEQAGGWRAISVRVSVSAPYPALVGLLQAIAEAPAPMLVDNLQIRGAPRDAKPGFPVQSSFNVTAYRAGKAEPS